MNQPSRWGFARLARLAAIFGAVALFGAGRLAAQGTTGKIEGTVRDQNHAPIAGAQVLIVGSAFASTTNEQGYYFINNVPAGVMSVRAQLIGYAPSEVRNVRVFAGQTMTVNVDLEQRAIQVGEITVTAQTAPIVPRDEVTSKDIIAGDVMQNLPVGNVTEMLRLQPGVVQSNRGLSIRGGRVGEAIVYIDGVPVRSVSGNTATASVGTNGVEEASVTTGAIGATQGDAQSGVISFVTRSGGPKFSGFLSMASDEMAGQTYGQGLDRLEASLGGPLARNLTFFVSTVMEGRQSARQGIGSQNVPIFALNGIDTVVTVPTTPGSATSDSTKVALPAFTRYSTGQRRPDQWNSDWNVDAKLQYTFGSGSRLSATFHRTRGQGLNSRGLGSLYDPQAQTGFINLSNALILNWSQNLARSSERALFLDASFSLQHDRSDAGLVDQSWFADNHKPLGWFGFSNVKLIFDQTNFPIDAALIQDLRNGTCINGRDTARPTLGACVPYLGRNDLAQSASFRANPYGVSAGSFATSGPGNQGIGLNKETRVTGRVNLDWQADRYNRFQFGGDFVSANSESYAASVSNQIFMDANIYKPSRFGLYATDRLDLGDVVVDLGLRYDQLNPDVLYPNTPGRLFTDPFRNGNAGLASATASGYIPTAFDSATAARCQAAITALDSLALSTCNTFAGATHHIVLPSVRVSFPVTDRTGFRLSYAQQAQTPDFANLAIAANTDLAYTNSNSTFGRDLNYGKTILFEFGVRHAFSQDMVLDISAYNKDKVSDITARIISVFDPTKNAQQSLRLMTNADFGNVRGIDFKLDRRIGSLFQGTLSYTYEQAKSTGSDPFEYIGSYARATNNVTGDVTPPPQALLTTRDNRDHTITGNLALNFPHGWHSGTATGTILQDVGIFATFRFASGLAYTRIDPSGGTGARGPGNLCGNVCTFTEPLNSSTTPWIKNVDLRLTRGFRVGGSKDITVFADFRNLFNFRNVVALFAETGDVVNAKFQTNTLSPQFVSLATEAGGLVHTCTVSAPCGSTTSGQAIDLTNCAAYNPTSTVGVPNCIMLQRAEARFGNGDKYFSDAEQNTAFTNFFNVNNAPYTLLGAGLNFRLGFELNF